MRIIETMENPDLILTVDFGKIPASGSMKKSLLQNSCRRLYDKIPVTQISR